MCPTSTWFGRITIAIGFVLLFFGSKHFTEILGYVFIGVSFVYSTFFTDKSCSVDDKKGKSNKIKPDVAKKELELDKNIVLIDVRTERELFKTR